MHLITMAHAGEAQSVIEKFDLKKTSPELFQNDQIVLLLTGEGPFEAATKTALTVPRFPISHIINLGIAGSLSAEFNIGDVVPVRSLYLIKDLRPEFKTFQSNETGVDCLTSFERILDQEKAKTLKGIGLLVDREAWGVAFAAKTAGIPFSAFKIVSDMAGTLGACELVKESAEIFSQKLALHLETLLSKEAPKKEDQRELRGFHFTFTTNEQFKKLMNKLMIKNECSFEEVLNKLPLKELRELDISPKERTKRLLKTLDEKIDPVKAKISYKMDVLLASFNREGLKVAHDPLWEETKLTISFEAGSDHDLQNKAEALRKLSLKNFTDIMEGKLDVE